MASRGTLQGARAPIVLESERRHQGRQFPPIAEAELHPVLLELAGSFRSSQMLLAIPEFYGVFGIADLVVVSASNARLASRLDADVAPLTYELDALIVSALSSTRPRSLDLVVRNTGLDHRTVDERLRRHLSRSGAVLRTPTGSLLRHQALASIGRVHALEAKVTDWRRAGRQARKYALWADSVSVVLGRAPRDRDSLVDEFSHHGIGLAVGSRWFHRPAARHHSMARRLMVSEMVISAIGSQSLRG